MAVGYGPARLVTPVADALHTALGLPLRDILRVEGGRYWSYMCTDESCCPGEGTLYVNQPACALPAPLADRAALAATVAPVEGEEADAMRQATRNAVQGRRITHGDIAAQDLLLVQGLITLAQQGDSPLNDLTVAMATIALTHLRVRDDAWARMDPEHKDAHIRLWTDVVRRAQPGYVAAPAALLAFVAWQSGNGALANVALDRALADDPRYSMALLLRQVITAGAPPSLARLPMTPGRGSRQLRRSRCRRPERSEVMSNDLEPAADGPDPSSPQWRALAMRRLRLERGWTVAQVGQKVGLHASQVSRAENGLKRPMTVPVICGVFEVTEAEVMVCLPALRVPAAGRFRLPAVRDRGTACLTRSWAR